MFAKGEKWNISFAGCGFSSVYYLGALTCILERVPHLVHGASKICGASSGCLVAAALTVGLPMEHMWSDLLAVAKEARKHRLSVFHPTFSLLRTVRDSLRKKLPEDAHRLASGRLCVSLTRLIDGSNILVSHFDTREELIQVLICSCFFPVYCGFIPPSYRGQLYIDGALSNNMPLLDHPNTITVAPFSSESDISPKDGAWTSISVHCNNLCLHVTAGNVRRIFTSFLPPAPEELAEIFQSGYTDALHFLRQENLLEQFSPEEQEDNLNVAKAPFWGQHWWLEHEQAQTLPLNYKRGEAIQVDVVLCRDAGDVTGLCPLDAFYYMLTPLVLVAELIWFVLNSLFTEKKQSRLDYDSSKT
nr:patatin-like phospholipase domain-containing protein 2 [Nerophis lumbriciformis]